MGIRPIIAGGLLAVGTCAQARAAGVVLPITQTPPTLDGHVTPDEWRTAAGFDGFGFGDTLGRRRARAFVTASATEIHVAIVSQLPTEGELLTTVDRDSLNAVHDDSVEVYVTPNPDSPDRVEYQLLVNSADFGGYNVHLLGNAKENVAMLLAEQNAIMALQYAKYGYIMENGRVVLDGDAATLSDNADVREFYLGLTEIGKKSYRDVKHYKRRKRWLA